jgi:hypothetical protein
VQAGCRRGPPAVPGGVACLVALVGGGDVKIAGYAGECWCVSGGYYGPRVGGGRCSGAVRQSVRVCVAKLGRYGTQAATGAGRSRSLTTIHSEPSLHSGLWTLAEPSSPRTAWSRCRCRCVCSCCLSRCPAPCPPLDRFCWGGPGLCALSAALTAPSTPRPRPGTRPRPAAVEQLTTNNISSLPGCASHRPRQPSIQQPRGGTHLPIDRRPACASIAHCRATCMLGHLPPATA